MMWALSLRAPRKLERVLVPIPAPGPGEVLVRTAASTICTSDINDIAANPFGIPLPMILGHEAAGTVAALGSGVDGVSVGQAVAAHPVIPCGACQTCREGMGHLCESMAHLGFTRPGTFAEYFTTPASRVRPVPAGVDLAAAALVEPVAVCLEAIRRAALHPGEAAAVVGDGPFGITIARLALRAGASPVVLVGQRPYRLGQVPGAIAVNERASGDIVSEVMRSLGGRGADVSVLAVASPKALDLALRMLRPRGRLVVFAAMHEPVAIDLLKVHIKELSILGACNDEDLFDEALALLADPELDLGRMVSHRLPFREWQRAFDLAENGKDSVLKIALTCGEGEV